eukprot:UN0115
MQDAERWIATMTDEGFTPGVVAYNSLISGAGRQQNTQAAKRYYDMMIAADVKPNVFVFNALLSGAAKASCLATARKWWAEMHTQGIRPTVVSYGTIINAHAKAGQIERAEELFFEMRASSLEANDRTISSLINFYAKRGNVSGAEMWSKRMSDLGIKPNVVLCTQFFDCYANARPKEVQRAEALLQFMLFEGIGLNAGARNALQRVVGRARFQELCKQHGIADRSTRMSAEAKEQQRRLELRSRRARDEIRSSPERQ